MKYLQVVKSPPEATTRVLMEALAQGHEVTRWNLYQDQDYDQLVQLIFDQDIVQSWW